jgi:2-succinyl-6-hydroxy-2,4-cyclohexadiene-1-carboxylate synthase
VTRSTIAAEAPGWAVRQTGAGRPVVLLHGFTGSGASWADHLEALATLYRVIVPDLPGHGGSTEVDPARMSVERMADDLSLILNRLDAWPADVLGYSLGARIALRLAIAHPEAVGRLILESPSAGIADPLARTKRRAEDAALAADLEQDGIVAFVDRWERQAVFASHAQLDPQVAGRQRALRLANDPGALAASLRAAGQGTMDPLHDRLAGIAGPTLIICGAMDELGRGRAERIAAAIPGARLAIVDDAGHTPHLERPDTFRRIVLAFLQEDLAA